MPARKHRRTETTHKSIVFNGLLADEFRRPVKPAHALAGALLGLVGGALVKYAINRVNLSTGGKVPDLVMRYVAPLSTFLAGVGLYVAQRSTNRERAAGLLAGASLAALAPVAWSLLGTYGPKMADGTPFFSDYVLLPFGLLTADQQQPYGLLTEDGVQPRFSAYDDDHVEPFYAP